MTPSAERSGLKRTLRRVFGIENLRPGQAEVIRSVLDGKNTLALMPTGAGKSLCYQLPSLQLEGMTVIVSPLISLMKDQVDKLTEKGLNAAQVNSALTGREQQEALEEIRQEQSDFVFTTPERLADSAFLDTLRGHKIDFIVLDEAHCISQWGHDFRPAFLTLKDAIQALGSPPVLALTATATDAVIEDIQKQLGLRDLEVINTGIYRPNLSYEVIHVTHEAEKNEHLARLLADSDGIGIVYTATVKSAEAVADFLTEAGVTAACYHGRLSAKLRKEHQDRFMANALKAMVATNAFGMGIDKPNIRFVIHYQMPGSLEAYYQESGRAGRDGEPARCILLYDLNDRRIQQFFMGGRYPSAEHISAVYQAMQQAAEASLTVSDLQRMVATVARTKIRVILALLKELSWVKERRGARLTLLKRDIPLETVAQTAQQYREKSEHDRVKLERMMHYAQNALCRWQDLLNYFSEEAPWERCGHCDNCLHPWEERIALTTSLRSGK